MHLTFPHLRTMRTRQRTKHVGHASARRGLRAGDARLCIARVDTVELLLGCLDRGSCASLKRQRFSSMTRAKSLVTIERAAFDVFPLVGGPVQLAPR